MKKRIKLSKNAMFVVSIIALIIVIVCVMKFSQGSEETTPKKSEDVLQGIVVEDATLKVTLLDFVSEKDYQDTYQTVNVVIDQDEVIQGYTISTKQTFSKVMMLLPPDDNSPLLNHNSEKPTHEAYSLVLKGDIVHYQNDGQDIYKIENARIDYYKQSLLLESDYGSVYIASLDGKKEKMVLLDEYKQAMASIETYMTMLQW